MSRQRWIFVGLSIVLAASGCGVGASDKAGGSGGITVLQLATPDPQGRPSSKDAEHFAERVHELSDGRLRVEIVWEAAGRSETGVRSWDQVVAQRVVDGREELGLVPARAWDELDVLSLQPLQAPFVVTTDAALDAVVNDDVAEHMLAGLESVGVTGLALVPEGLRHPVGRGEPLLEPADFAGALVRAPRSILTWDALRALGAEPDDFNGADVLPVLQSGQLRGAETSAALLPTLQWNGVLTGNVTLYAKANALVVNTAALERLSAGERSVLQRAAIETRDSAVDSRQSEADSLRGACEAGAAVAVATDEQLAALRQATAVVVERLRADAEIGPLLDRVVDVVEGTGPAPVVEPCGTDFGDAAIAGESTDALDGVWRIDVSYEDGLRAGLSEGRAAAELGVQTVRMQAGEYTWSWRSRRGEQSCDGTYRMDAGLVVFTDEPACGGVWEARPDVSVDEIQWVDVRTRDRAGDREDQTVRELLHSTPWRRIVDAARTLPEGVYRWRIAEDQLTAVGVDEASARSNSGLMTFTVRNGRWLHHTEHPSRPPDCGGTYVVSGSRVTFTADRTPDCGSAAGGVLFSGSWTEQPDGLRFTEIRPDDPFMRVLWGAALWQRIG